MPITEADVEKIAQLAHMEITPAELKIFAPQMADIVAYVEQLNALDTRQVEPALGGLTPEGEATDSARDDATAPPDATCNARTSACIGRSSRT